MKPQFKHSNRGYKFLQRVKITKNKKTVNADLYICVPVLWADKNDGVVFLLRFSDKPHDYETNIQVVNLLKNRVP